MPDPIRIPKRECDLVMKGGVTSGIVYPPAILVLKEHYVFNSIGGTSAGAVAAAATAAAEFGRSHIDDKGDGFDRLKLALDEFTGDGKLFERFGAPPQTRPVIELLRAVGALGGPMKSSNILLKIASGLWSLLRWNSLASVLGLIVGALIGVVLGFALPGFADDFLDWAGYATGGLNDVLAPIGLAIVVGGIALLTVGRVLGQWSRAAGFGIIAFNVVFLLIAATGYIASLLFGFNMWRAGAVVFTTLAVALPGAGVGGLLDLAFASFFRGTRANLLGIVNGHDPMYAHAQPERLTDFMYERLNIIAGMKRTDADWHPLTFGDLTRRKLVIGSEKESRPIRLEMITTNLSQGIPYRLPFKSDQESYRFIFNENEFRTLFPDEVVDFMIRNEKSVDPSSDSRKRQKAPSFDLPDGYHFLPDPDLLPVVVGMRMSLAIPIFFSVVPLYTVSPRALLRYSKSDQNDREEKPWPVAPYKEDGGDQDLQRHLFSDGGTTSNFPIQLFDKLIPTRPTFGITIASMPEDAKLKVSAGEDVFPRWTVSTIPEQLDDEEQVEPARRTQEFEVERVELGGSNRLRGIEHRSITSPISLLSSVVDTARENRETMLAVRPGYRERIVRIRLTQDEGGMNLAMDRATINKMIPLGAEAGAKLLWPGIITAVPRPGGEPKMVKGMFDFDDHRWVRFLISMSQLETELQKFKYAYKLRDYAELLDNDRIRQRPYYRTHEGKWLEQARKNVDDLIGAVDKWPLSAAAAAADAGSAVVDPAYDAHHAEPTGAIMFYFFNNRPDKEDRLPKPKLALKMSPDF